VKAVNLIPADQRRGAGGIAGRSGGIVYVVVGGLTVIVALGTVYAFSVKTVADRKGQLADVTAQTSAVQAQAAALAGYVSVEQLRQSAVSGAVGLAEQRFDWPDAMRQLALALPSDVTLTGLSASTAAATSSSTATPSPTTSATSGPSFALQGCTSSQGEVATVVARLEQLPGVTGVSLSNASKTGNAPNDGKPVARSKAEAKGGGCPLVSFSLSMTYGTTYTVPNERLKAQTVASASADAGAGVRATTMQPSR
jgi:hypothetical protein